MGSDRYNSNLVLIGTITPEDTISARLLILPIRLKDLLCLIVWMSKGREIVGIQTRVMRILKEKLDRLVNLYEEPFLLRGLSLVLVVALISGC